MEMRSINLKIVLKNIFCFNVILLGMFFNFKNINAAENHTLSLSAVKCDMTRYEDQVGDDKYYTCLDDYLNGDLDSYVIHSNDDVEPGTVLLGIVNYTPGSVAAVTGINTTIKFDTSKWQAITDESGALLYDYDDTQFPKSGRRTNWSTEFNLNEENGWIKLLSYDDTSFIPLDSEIELGYFFIKLDESAEPGSQASLDFSNEGGDTDMTDEMGEQLPFEITPFPLNVYGEQSKDASLKTLTVKNNDTYYLLTPDFTPGSTDTKEYNVYVPSNISEVDIEATPNHQDANILPGGGMGHQSIASGNNTFQITVTSQYGNTEIYTINVYRLSDIATLQTLSLTDVNIGSFSSETFTYEATVPYRLNETVVSATPTSELATVEGTGSFSLPLYGDTANTKNIVVKAENCKEEYKNVPGNACTSNTYTLNIFKENPSSNSYLSELKVNNNSVPEFQKENKDYTLEPVSNDTTSINISGVVEDTGKANIISGTGDIPLSVGDNTLEIVVEAEDKSTTTYVIHVHRLSNDATLKSLNVTSDPKGNFSPLFQENFTGDYTYSYPSTVTEITIDATVKDTDKASVTIFDSDSEEEGDAVLNTTSKNFTSETKNVTIMVTAEDGTVKNYTLKLEREKSSDTTLKSLSLNHGELSPEFNPQTRTYKATVDGTIEEVEVTAIVNFPEAQVIKIDGNTNLEFGNNQIEITVQAENGSQASYIINLTRERRTDATLSDLKINGQTIESFDKDTTTYVLEDVPYQTTALNIEAIPNDSLATKKGDGLITLNTGDNTIKITVTAHDARVTKDYIIKVKRTLNNDTSIKKITLAGQEAQKKDDTHYEVTVPNNVTEANEENLIVEVSDTLLPSDPKANVSFNNTPLSTKNLNIVTITVTAEDQTEKTYQLEVTREKSDVATLNSLTVTNGSFNPSFKSEIFDYHVTLPVSATEFDIAATLTEENAKIISGTGHYSLTNKVTEVDVVVVSENEEVTNTYHLTIERTASADYKLSSLTVSEGTLSPDFNPDVNRYTVDVDWQVEQINVDATTRDERAKILSGTGSHGLEVGDNVITVEVQNEAGDTYTYTITVRRPKKENAYLKELKVDDQLVANFNKETLEYTLDEVEYSKNEITITAVPEDDDATVVSPQTIPLKTGENVIKITVTAQNQDVTKTYILNITRKKNDNAKLSMLSINGYVLTPNFSADNLEYNVTVSETKDRLDPSEVTAIAQDSNAKVTKQEAISIVAGEDNTYQVTVVAENEEASETYIIHVNRPLSSDATLKSVDVQDAQLLEKFDPEKTDYTISVPYGQKNFSITGVPNVTTSTVEGNGEYELSDGSITLTVKAQNGSTKTYNFTLIEALSNDATLSNLSVTGYPFDQTFNSAITNYDIGNIPYSTNQLEIIATPTNTHANVTYYVNGELQANNIISIPEVVGQKTITVKVVAADGITTKNYNISYNLIYSNNAFLSKLEPTVGKLEFSKTQKYYEITVANDVTSISFDIETEDSNAHIKVNEDTFATPKRITMDNLSVGDNTLTILVTAQDNTTTNTYNVVVKRLEPVASNDAWLKSLSVDNYSLDKEFEMTNLDYSIGNIPFSLTELTINAVANMQGSKITYLVNGVKQDSNKVVLPKEKGNGTITVQVTAEDGITVKNYQIRYQKEPNTNAYLQDIKVSEGTLNFDKNTYSYTVNVDRNVTKIDITAILEDDTASLSMNGEIYESPHTLTISPLQSGDTEVTIIVTAENGSVLTYKVLIQKEADIATTITSEIYGHKIENGYIKTVSLNTTAIEMKDQLDNENKYLEIWTADESHKLNDGEKVATGMIVKLIIDGTEKDRKLIVIKGDTSGDGEIDLFDAVKILNDYLGRTLLEGAYKEAAYVNDDNEIDLFDSVLILNHYLGRISIH